MSSAVPIALQNKPMHEALKPIQWLVGKWVSTNGQGTFPNIPPFMYCEQIEFTSHGQPLLNYTGYSWHPEKQNPMHLESGFLRINPASQQLAFMVAHNLGLTTIEEGVAEGNCVTFTTKHVSRMSFAKDPQVTKLVRLFTLKDDTLQQIVQMETTNTPLNEHLRASYKRV